MTQEQMAALVRQLEGMGVTTTRIQTLIRGALGELGLDSADYLVVAPIIVRARNETVHPDGPHGLLIDFNTGIGSLLNQQGVIDAQAVAQPVICSKN